MIIRGIRQKSFKNIKLGDIFIVHTKEEYEYYMIVYDDINKVFGYLNLNTYKVINSFYDENIRHEDIQSLATEVGDIGIYSSTMLVDRNDCILDFKTEKVF